MTTTPQTSVVQTRMSSPVRYIILGLLILAAGIVVTALTIYGLPELPALGKKSAETQPPAKARLAVELAEDVPHTLVVPERVTPGLREGALYEILAERKDEPADWLA